MRSKSDSWQPFVGQTGRSLRCCCGELWPRVAKPLDVILLCNPQEEKLASAEAQYNLSCRTGSLLYMAPEVIRCEQYNEKVDVFSFASVLYELLQGATMMTFISPTPSSQDIDSYMMAVASGFRPTIPDMWPAEIKGLIADCWEDAPLARPTMSEVVERLQIMYADGMFVRKSTASSLFRALCC